MKNVVYGRKKQQKHDLVIKSHERIELITINMIFPDAGIYPFEGPTQENEYDMFSENGKIGTINIISKTQALIETDYDEEDQLIHNCSREWK